MIKSEKDLFEDVKKERPLLDDIYYGNKNLMSNFENFHRLLVQNKELRNTIDDKEAKLYYDNQEVRQVFEPHVKSEQFRSIVAFYPFQRIYMDTMYLRLNNSTLAFCNVIDLFSKYAYSKMFVLKKRSQAIKSIQSLEVLKGFFAKIESEFGLKKNDVGHLTMDAGSEFKGDMTNYVNDENILHSYGHAGDKRKMSPVERFNRTLRWYLEKYKLIYGRIDNNVLTKILDAYNNVPHGKIKYPPIELIKSKEKQLETEKHFIDLSNENNVRTLNVGDKVRVLLDRTPFQKTKPVWSTTVYTIAEVQFENYKLDDKDGLWKRDELQPLNESILMKKEEST